MLITNTAIADLYIITPDRIEDERGFFSETWSEKKIRDAGLLLPKFVQDNHSLSYNVNTVRGLHYQSPPLSQGKLVRCARGRLFDVAVDIRRGSPSFGRWFGIELSFLNGKQLWIPPGFLHGFITREDNTEVSYKCSAPYSSQHEGSVSWNSVGIDWQATGPVTLSPKDASAQDFGSFISPFEYGEGS